MRFPLHDNGMGFALSTTILFLMSDIIKTQLEKTGSSHLILSTIGAKVRRLLRRYRQSMHLPTSRLTTGLVYDEKPEKIGEYKKNLENA